jgi:hypothetical protein
MVTSVAVPALLCTIALIDATLSGFRAATGRNGQIRKRHYYLMAMLRGLSIGVVALAAVGAVLAAAASLDARHTRLVNAGAAMLYVYGPFAALVIASLIGYWLLPRRSATYLIVLGLGPMTLIRPLVAIAGGIAVIATTSDTVVWSCAALAVVAVLGIEPWIHHRWYAQPC